ncbi:hypothetical protein L596_027164 [Steinernema carpocapsae]|uniref:cystathionine beta-synthase n=1 Tax=Steinernema carpocapsae TaxID=34508 RepID=A0A4U5M3I4_STECR|nr:hypothetical protein L596_027164 [Steinernema carpocapsae]
MASNNDYMPWGEAPQWDWSEEGITDQHGLHRFMDRYSHSHRMQRPKIYDNILTAIGDSPLVKLHKIPERFGVECNVYVKPELFNSGGSIKDRVALKMIETAEAQRRLKPGMTIIEPTSGNTGIGLALVAAVKGYKCIIVMPDNMSKEKADLMHALGVKIVRTPAVPYADPDSHVNLAFRMQKQIPGSIVLNQYLNCANPLTHYEGTGNEILDALNENVDMIVAGVGTGGTITGVAKKCKNVNPNCIIVGADPIGKPDEKNYHLEVEGIHPKDGMPVVLDTSFIDEWIKVSDKDVFTTARQMIQEEGILCGGSSGCAIWAAMQAAKKNARIAWLSCLTALGTI